MKFKYLILATTMLLTKQLFSQSDADVLRYSNPSLTGTARSIGLAGATGALGSDYNNASNNPGGLGLYRTSEFTASPTIYNGRTFSTYLGNETRDGKPSFGFGNMGLVFHNQYSIKGKEVTKGWTGVTFAMGYNKLAKFSNYTTYSGYNKFNSIGDKFAEDISGKEIFPKEATSFNPWGAGSAFNAYLIDPDYANDSSQYVAITKGGNVNQFYSKETKGGINEMAISLAGNYENRFSVGGTLGIPALNYTERIDYTETNDSLKVANFKSFNSSSYVRVSGIGINLKLGGVFLVNDYLRLGVAVHTPTLYQLKDSGTITMTTHRSMLDSNLIYQPGEYSTLPITNLIKYNLVAPWKFIASAVFTYKKLGFISVDYELLDYTNGSIKYRSTNAFDAKAASDINKTIQNNYTLTSNLKIGAEFKYDIFALRGGYSYLGSPFKSPIINDYNYATQSFSVGVGIREKNYFIDLGMQQSIQKTIDMPYVFATGSTQATPVAKIKTNYTTVMATVGFKF